MIFCLLLASSCSTAGEGIFGPQKTDIIDPALGLNRSDYTHLLDKDFQKKTGGQSADGANPSEPPIPALAEILAAPEPPKLAESKLVSVAVTEDVPLKDVLIEVARLADVDIEVDAGITGGVSFRAKDRPFNEVVERICDLAGLRYSVKNGVLRVERDTPYIQLYSLDLLNVERTGSGNMDVNTTTGSAGGGGTTSSSVGSGSKSNITIKNASDFWAQFEESIKQILAYQDSVRTSGTVMASQTPAPPTPEPAGKVSSASPAAARPAAVPVGAVPVAPSAASGAAFYVLNKQASTLTVSATDKQHRILKRFIDKIQDNASAQVLIEAKIVEVSLSDEYRSGIQWERFNGKNLVQASASFPITNPANGVTPFTLAFQDNALNLAAAVTLTEQFGTTRTLSSPRLHATNNQQALMTFADNLVFFDLKFTVKDPTLDSNGDVKTPGSVTANATVHTVPIGILLSLQPSINKETNEVTLSVRPTLSRILGYTEDPSVKINLASAGITSDIKSQVPVVQVRELDSVMKVKSGQVMVIGGLMESNNSNADTGIPGASSVPFVGNLFKSVEKNNTSKELVIFIKATIVGSNGNAVEADKNLYNKFTQDPRPLFKNDGSAPAPESAAEPAPQPAPDQPVENTHPSAASGTPSINEPINTTPPAIEINEFPAPTIPPLAPLVHQ
ncbi:MAG: hypothetical protein EBR02_07710 [Alphaproteobacteria bacterium]|nr:hypothetical protein [Alphaproteobacteria bacterium]